MKVVILAGGFGTRISEESAMKPKPMVEIGGKPILWHIMKIYSTYGFNDFVICAGYKQEVIKEYFANYYLRNSDVTFDFSGNSLKTIIHHKFVEKWKVSVIDTGLSTQTGGRVKKIKEYIGDEPFMLTYGDGVGDVDISALLSYHKQHGKIGTITTYNFGQSKGVVDVADNGCINAFREKSNIDGDLINIGFMVLNPEIFNYIPNDDTVLEKEPLLGLVKEHQLMSFTHKGYWQCMDTLREKQALENLWETGKAPWKIWKD
jgi:glucose-1-phosphate cytidylyltransferase